MCLNYIRKINTVKYPGYGYQAPWRGNIAYIRILECYYNKHLLVVSYGETDLLQFIEWTAI